MMKSSDIISGSFSDEMSSAIVQDKVRLTGIDRIRGFAVFLMVLDHYLLFSGHSDSLIRLTFTRAALPLFCLLAGALHRRNHHRVLEIFLVGCGSFILSFFGNRVGQPDVCLLLALGLIFLPWLSHPVVMVLAALQPVTWHIPWTGYQPGTIVILLCIGLNFTSCKFVLNFSGLSLIPRGFEWFGRYPLSFYFLHLLVFTLLF